MGASRTGGSHLQAPLIPVNMKCFSVEPIGHGLNQCPRQERQPAYFGGLVDPPAKGCYHQIETWGGLVRNGRAFHPGGRRVGDLVLAALADNKKTLNASFLTGNFAQGIRQKIKNERLIRTLFGDGWSLSKAI